MITETDEVSDALADAATTSVAAERAAVEKTSGALTGIYQPGDLEALRQDWPA